MMKQNQVSSLSGQCVTGENNTFIKNSLSAQLEAQKDKHCYHICHIHEDIHRHKETSQQR